MNPFGGFGAVAGNVNMLAGGLQGAIAAQEDRRKQAQINFENAFQLANQAQQQANWNLSRGDRLTDRAEDNAWRSKVFQTEQERWATTRGDSLTQRQQEQDWRSKVFGANQDWQAKQFGAAQNKTAIDMAMHGLDPSGVVQGIDTGGILGSLFGNPYSRIAATAVENQRALAMINHPDRQVKPPTLEEQEKITNLQDEAKRPGPEGEKARRILAGAGKAVPFAQQTGAPSRSWWNTAETAAMLGPRAAWKYNPISMTSRGIGALANWSTAPLTSWWDQEVVPPSPEQVRYAAEQKLMDVLNRKRGM